MLQTANTPAVNRPNSVAVGTIVWLGSEVMFFAGLFAIYFTLKTVQPGLWEESVKHLNVPYAAVNTLILVSSSFTCQFGVFAAERLQARSTGWRPSEWGMVEWFFLTTGFHGLHVTGGLIAFLLTIGRAFAVRNFGHKEATTAIVVSYYWHFVDVVWIGLFLVIYVLQANG